MISGRGAPRNEPITSSVSSWISYSAASEISSSTRRRGLYFKLAHKFGAYRAASSRDEDRLVARLACEQFGVGWNLVAAEQIVDLEGAQIADAYAARGDVLDRRQHFYLDRVHRQLLQHAAAFTAAFLGQRDQDLAHIVALDQRPHVIGIVDLEPGDIPAPERRLGVDESHRLAIVGAAQRGEKLHAELAGAEDDDGLTLGIGSQLGEAYARALKRHRGERAARGDEQRRQRSVGDHDRARDALLPGHEYEQRPDQHRQPDAADDPGVPTIAEVARHELVEAGERERHDCNQRRAKQQQRGREVRRNVERRVAQRDRQPQRHADQQEVERHEDTALVEAWQLKQPSLPTRP